MSYYYPSQGRSSNQYNYIYPNEQPNWVNNYQHCPERQPSSYLTTTRLSNFPNSSSSSYPTSPTSQPYSSYPTYPEHPPATTTTPEYICLFQTCRYSCARKADLERHVAAVHTYAYQEKYSCAVPGCHRRGSYGFSRKDKLTEHLREVHKCDIPKREARRA